MLVMAIYRLDIDLFSQHLPKEVETVSAPNYKRAAPLEHGEQVILDATSADLLANATTDDAWFIANAQRIGRHWWYIYFRAGLDAFRRITPAKIKSAATWLPKKLGSGLLWVILLVVRLLCGSVLLLIYQTGICVKWVRQTWQSSFRGKRAGKTLIISGVVFPVVAFTLTFAALCWANQNTWSALGGKGYNLGICPAYFYFAGTAFLAGVAIAGIVTIVAMRYLPER